LLHNGDYECLSELGKGGMGRVLLARSITYHHTKSGVVAIKLMTYGHNDSKIFDLFRAEENFGKELRHDNLALTYRFLDLRQDPGWTEDAAIVQQRYDTSLDRLIEQLRSHGPIALERALDWLRQIAAGVAYMHVKGFVHRDLKTPNVLVDYGQDYFDPSRLDQWQFVVSDFGLIWRVGEPQTVVLHQERDAQGNLLNWKAPETVDDRGRGIRDRPADPKQDIWSFGEIIRHIADIVEGQPEFLMRIADECQQPDPTLRPSAKELERRFSNLVLGTAIKDPHTFPPPKRLTAGMTERRPRRLLLSAIGLVLAMAGVFLGILFHFETKYGFLKIWLTPNEESTPRPAVPIGPLVDYAKQIATVAHDLKARRYDEATKRIDQCSGEQRGWEWRYLSNNCRPEVRVLPGHSETMYFVKVSPSGRFVLTLGRDDLQKVSDVVSGQAFEVKADGRSPLGWAFSPDSRHLAQRLPDGSLVTRETSSGREVRRVALEEGKSRQLRSFTPDGKYVVVTDAQHAIRICDAISGQEFRVLAAHEGEIHCLAFDAAGTRLASGSSDRTVRVWDWNNGKELQSLTNLPEAINSLAFRGDDQELVARCRDGLLLSWDLKLASETDSVMGPNWKATFSLSPDGRWLVVGDDGNPRVAVFDARTGRHLFDLDKHAKAVRGWDFSPDNRRLATVAGWDRTSDSIRIWDFEREWARRTFRIRDAGVNALAFAPDGTQMVAAENDGRVAIHDVIFDELRQEWEAHLGPVRRVEWSRAGNLIASGGDDGTVKLWDADTGAAKHSLTGHAGTVTGLAFSPDGTVLASVGVDQQVRTWDTASGQALNTLARHPSQIWDVAFSPDQQRIATACGDGTVRLWNEAGKQWTVLRGHAGAAHAVAFHPNSRWLASGSADGTVRLWDLGKELYILDVFQGPVLDVTFTPDGKRLAAAGADKHIRLFDAATGIELLTLEGHDDGIRNLVFAPDGQWLASVAENNVVKLWDGKRDGN